MVSWCRNSFWTNRYSILRMLVTSYQHISDIKTCCDKVNDHVVNRKNHVVSGSDNDRWLRIILIIILRQHISLLSNAIGTTRLLDFFYDSKILVAGLKYLVGMKLDKWVVCEALISLPFMVEFDANANIGLENLLLLWINYQILDIFCIAMHLMNKIYQY
jgi:hypothetical protein